MQPGSAHSTMQPGSVVTAAAALSSTLASVQLLAWCKVCCFVCSGMMVWLAGVCVWAQNTQCDCQQNLTLLQAAIMHALALPGALQFALQSHPILCNTCTGSVLAQLSEWRCVQMQLIVDTQSSAKSLGTNRPSDFS